MALSIKAETIFEVGGFAVTNSFISVLIIAAFLILFFVTYKNKLEIIPRSKFQMFVEWVVVSLNNLCEEIVGAGTAKTIFPLIFTFFILIIGSNWFGILPIVGSIGEAHKIKSEETTSSQILVLGEHTEITNKFEIEPWLRSPSADLNFTVALAILSFVLIQYSAISKLKFEYLGRFFDYRVAIGKGWKILLTPFMFLLNFFWKTLELILEFSKILSFSFRLFGNIFAGEVLLLVITTLTLGIAVLPILGFEIFVGFIQAIVFIFLTMVFIKVSSEAHH